MEKAPWISREQSMNPYAILVRRAVILCALAVPVVGFNMFASSRHEEAILYWSLAITVTSTLIGSAFLLWAANILWPRSGHRAAAAAK